jgi:hypothetical protein
VRRANAGPYLSHHLGSDAVSLLFVNITRGTYRKFGLQGAAGMQSSDSPIAGGLLESQDRMQGRTS